MSTQDSIQRDHFQLGRLAEELAARELRSGGTLPGEDELTPAEHRLPVYIPLSHDDPHLSAEHFNVEEFLLSRTYTSLPDLRSELRDYLATLKEELVKLINDDYEAFISLSTDLKDEGVRMERLKWPLGDIRGKVLESQSELKRIQDTVQLKLKTRATLREEKAFLHLLLKISESTTRLETLLLIDSPSDSEATSNVRNVIKPLVTRADSSGLDDRIRGSRAKHLSRVAAEYTQLLYHVSKAKAEKCAFIDEMQWRIDRIQSTLSSDLDHLFSSTVVALTAAKEGSKSTRSTESDKAKWIADVTECLLTYDSLGLWQDAEEILRRDVVHEFIKRAIYPGALSAPHSPIIPHTPFPPGASSLQPPRTPYTPFSAFASKQNPFDFSLQKGGLSVAHAHILDDADDPLAALYNAILRFVERDMKRIMELADKVGLKAGARSQLPAARGLSGRKVSLSLSKGPQGQSEGGGFEIMANVVWAELGKAVMDELGSVIFAAGNPDEFRQHHETTQAFIRSLEYLAPSVQSISAMRAHPVYSTFERRWQLPVYFQLRWKEIVTKLEDVLVVTRLERTPTKGLAPFVTPQTAAVWDAISSCWSAQVYIPELGFRFWKFHLQLISRYKSWLDKSLPPLETSSTIAISDKHLGGSSTPLSVNRAATPSIPTEPSSAESIAADEAMLVQLGTAIADIKAFEQQIWKLWREELHILLPESEVLGAVGGGPATLEDALRHAMSALLSIIPPLCSQIILILSRRGCDALLAMRSIPSQFRAMTSSRRMPTEASFFVSVIFKALKSFFAIGTADGPGASLKNEYLHAFAEETFEVVTQRYIFFLNAMKKTEESLRRLKKGKKSTYSLFGGSSAPREDDGRADEEKIRVQMILDVAAFKREAESLGVAVDSSEAYRILKELADASLDDDIL